MVTGKLSEATRSFVRNSGLRISEQDVSLRARALKTPQLGWRLAGGSPQWAATSDLSRMVSPGPVRNTDNKLAPTRSKQNRLGDKALIEEHPRLLRGVNSMVKPNGRLVLVSFTHHCAFTPSLSTRSSSWALQGDLILGRASRLYAFSGYHNRTSLPSHALGRTTGTQEVRPSRSSRTKDSPPQISYAHSR